MAEWTTVAKTGDVPDDGILGASLDDQDLMVVKVDGKYRVLGATCTHAGCNIADDGELEDGSVTCMCHGSIFDLETGEAIGPPADEPLPVFQVQVEGDEIRVARPGTEAGEED